ncbi:solute carrier family 15 member 5 isoform X3 [Crotalus tigris]|uniref:solute carrier family 15 member 5 isoform X3 n=1 Tax=Crotalus tigris TaxID=88082 RepID=UPI00192F1AA2|nr:solute carrier family 15 member 5 isoform X3 [Crotalus tigris]
MPLLDLRLRQEERLLSHISKVERRQTNPLGLTSSKFEKEFQAMVCLLLVELCEKFTFYGIVCNMLLFCTIKLGYHNYEAAMLNVCFAGACTVAPVLMGWLAEHPVGQIRLVYLCALLHFIGTALLPVVAFPFEDFFIDKHYVLHTLAKKKQEALFYIALLATCLGSGGIRAIVCPLSVYNPDEHRPKELLSFFNWFYWLINLSSAVVFISISYIQQSVAQNLGFLIPFVSVLMGLITIHMARSEMIYQPPRGSCLLTICGIIANALKLCCVQCRYFSGNVANWLDHAKENYGGCYTETQVENTKLLIRLFPLFAFQILYRSCIMQIPSGYYIQTMNSNLNLNGFLLPIAAMNLISILPFLILAPLLECINACLLNAKASGWYPMICIGVFITFRFLPGQIRGVAMQILTFFNGAGCIMGAFLIQITYVGSQGEWFPNILNEGKFERFYFFLASLMIVNTLGFWTTSHKYNNLREDYDEGFRGSLLQEQLLQHEKSLKFYDSILVCPSPLSQMETLL